MYEREIARQRLRIEGIPCSRKEVEADAKHTKARTDIRRELSLFLQEWFSPSPTLTVQTSGSTGTPKRCRVAKSRMIESALLTCSALRLQPGDKALLCLPLDYIAGKMMAVRALVADLDLYPVEPSSHPLAECDEQFCFAAMIPLQVSRSLEIPEERAQLARIERLIIGGAAIDPVLEEALQSLPGALFSSYGMTETLSHIALRRLNGPERSERYRPFAGIELSLSANETLVIDAPTLCEAPLTTNDRAELFPDGSFRILGRRDNTLNCGGVKIQIESVENRLKPLLQEPFVVTGAADGPFGEIVVLLTEGSPDRSRFQPLFEQALPRYWRPKRIYDVTAVPMTPNGKPDRKAARRIAETRYREEKPDAPTRL